MWYWHRRASVAPSIRNPVADEEMMSPCHWLQLVLCVSFSALVLMVGSQEGRLAHKNPIPLIPIVSVQEQVNEEDPRRTD